MNWLKWLWNVATRVVLPAVTAVQRVVQQREAASKQKPEPKAANAANGVNKPKPAAPSPQPPPIPQRRTAAPDRDIGPRIDPTPAPVMTPGEQLTLQDLLDKPRNRGLHLLVEPDAEIVLKIAHRIPGILETAVQNLGSFKAAFDYLLANGVSLAEEEIASILQSNGPQTIGQSADWCLDIVDRNGRRACQIAQIEAMGHALLPSPSAWSDENLDNFYVSLSFSRDWEHPAQPLAFNPDDYCLPCVTLPSARLQVLGYADFWNAAISKFDPPNVTGDYGGMDLDDLRGVLEGERDALAPSISFRRLVLPYNTSYEFTEREVNGRSVIVPTQLAVADLALWTDIKPGDIVLYSNFNFPYLGAGGFPHVLEAIGWGSQNWGYDSPSQIERNADLTPVGVYPSLSSALEAGVTQPLPFLVDRGYRPGSCESGIDPIENRGGKPLNWNSERLGDYSELMYAMVEGESAIEIWVRRETPAQGGNVR